VKSLDGEIGDGSYSNGSGLPDQRDSRCAGACWSLIVIRDLMFGNRRDFRELLTRSEGADSLEDSG
jgi:hypothetical protein